MVIILVLEYSARYVSWYWNIVLGKCNWASEASPTLGCSIEISRGMSVGVYVCMYVCMSVVVQKA